VLSSICLFGRKIMALSLEHWVLTEVDEIVDFWIILKWLNIYLATYSMFFRINWRNLPLQVQWWSNHVVLRSQCVTTIRRRRPWHGFPSWTDTWDSREANEQACAVICWEPSREYCIYRLDVLLCNVLAW
jgi:hypothetical protein